MEYEITRDCRFGRRGKIVDYSTYSSASYEERKTCFREVIGSVSTYTPSYDSSSTNVIDFLTDSSSNDTSSFSSSNDTSDNSSFDGFGGGDFGGGGASSDY